MAGAGARQAARASLAAVALLPALAWALPAAPEPLPREVDVSVVWQGDLIRYRLDGDRLTVRVRADELRVDRRLTADERRRVVEAARTAQRDGETQFDCARGPELFIAVTVDAKIRFTAVCPEARVRPDLWTAWEALARLLREVAGPAALAAPGPSGGASRLPVAPARRN